MSRLFQNKDGAKKRGRLQYLAVDRRIGKYPRVHRAPLGDKPNSGTGEHLALVSSKRIYPFIEREGG